MKLLREKGCIESHGFAIGIDENKLLRTWRERGCNNTAVFISLQIMEACLPPNLALVAD